MVERQKVGKYTRESWGTEGKIQVPTEVYRNDSSLLWLHTISDSHLPSLFPIEILI